MDRSSEISVLIDTELKEKAENILKQLGIEPSVAIQMFYAQIVLNKGLPFKTDNSYKKPISVDSLSKEQLSAELFKGIESVKEGVFYTDSDIENIIK